MGWIWYKTCKFSWAIISFVYLDNLITMQMPYSTRCGYEQILSLIHIHSNNSNNFELCPGPGQVGWARVALVVIPVLLWTRIQFEFLMNYQILSWTRFRRSKNCYFSQAEIMSAQPCIVLNDPSIYKTTLEYRIENFRF